MSERETLTCRQIDRPVRPMFAEGFKCETQVIALVLSADTENDPDVCGINAALGRLDPVRYSFSRPDRRRARRLLSPWTLHRQSHLHPKCGKAY